MERLVSLFRRPEDFEFAEFDQSAYPYPWLDAKGEDGEPEYFVQLMQYLREQRDEEAVRQGAD